VLVGLESDIGDPGDYPCAIPSRPEYYMIR
jgi:hypothetical protein